MTTFGLLEGWQIENRRLKERGRRYGGIGIYDEYW